MGRSLRRFGRALAARLEHLAVRAGNDKLIYQDILCMSWATVLDQGDAAKHGSASTPVEPKLGDPESAKGSKDRRTTFFKADVAAERPGDNVETFVSQITHEAT